MARSKGLDVGVKIKGDAKSYKAAAAQARTATQKLSTQFKKQNSTLGKLSKSIKLFGAAIVTAIAVKAVRAVVGFGKELIRLGGDIQGVRAAFKTLDDPYLLDEMKKATRGTISNLELMRVAVQAKNFKIPLEQLGTYFEFATKRAIETGNSVEKLVQTLVLGIGMKSTQRLDDLGITLVEIQKEVKKVGDFGLATGNIIRNELEGMGKIASTATTKIAALSTVWTNIKVKAGELFVTAPGFAKFIDNLTKNLPKIINNFIEVINKIITWRNNTAKIREANAMFFSWMARGLIYIKGHINDIVSTFEFMSDAMVAMSGKDKLQKMSELWANYRAEIRETEDEIKIRVGKELDNLLEKTEKLSDWKLIPYVSEVIGGPAVKRPVDKLTIDDGIGLTYAKKHALLTKAYKREKLALENHNADLIALDERFTYNRIKLARELIDSIGRAKAIGVHPDNLQAIRDQNAKDLELLTSKHEAERKEITSQDEALLALKQKFYDRGNELAENERDRTLIGGLEEERYTIDTSLKSVEDIYKAHYKILETLAEKNRLSKAAKLAKELDDVRTSLQHAQDIAYAYSDMYSAMKDKELSKVGDNADKRTAIEEKWAKKEQRMAVAMATINVLQGVTKAFAQGGVLGFITGGLVLTAGMAQVAAIASHEFAQGGIVSGPTLATVGEYAGARSNPEVIAPLNKLKALLGNTGMAGEVTFRIEGDTLVGVLNNKNRQINSYN